jgi:hypothetical protein
MIPITERLFETDDATQVPPKRWLTAVIPYDAKRLDNCTVISFKTDSLTSPLAQGISGDGRTLGLALSKLQLGFEERTR